MVCSDRFGGARNRGLASPPSCCGCRCPGRGPGALDRRLRRRTVLGRKRGGRHLPGQGDRRQLPDQAAARPDLPARARRPQHRRQDDPRPDRERLDQGQGGRRPPPCPSGSTIPSRNWPSPTGRSGCSPSTTPSSPAPRPPAAPEPRTRRPLTSAPLKKGATANVVWKLSAVKAGNYTLLYGIEAGLSGKTKAETGGGVSPGRLLLGEDQLGRTQHRSHRQRGSRRKEIGVGG